MGFEKDLRYLTNLPEELNKNINDMNKHFINFPTTQKSTNHLDILKKYYPLRICNPSLPFEFKSEDKNEVLLYYLNIKSKSNAFGVDQILLKMLQIFELVIIQISPLINHCLYTSKYPNAQKKTIV